MKYTIESLIRMRPMIPGCSVSHVETNRRWDQAMFNLRMSLGEGNNIEIGCRYGNSTIPMASALVNICPIFKHYAFDPFIERAHQGTYIKNFSKEDPDFYIEKFNETILLYDANLLSFIVPVIGYSQDIIGKFDLVKNFTPVAMIFIDGDHSDVAVCSDILNYHSYVKVGGVISFDDWGGFGVTQGYEKAKPQMIGVWSCPEQFAHSRVFIKRIK